MKDLIINILMVTFGLITLFFMSHLFLDIRDTQKAMAMFIGSMSGMGLVSLYVIKLLK